MKKSLTLTIKWWMTDTNGNRSDVPAEYEDALTESGYDHAFQMLAGGFTSGELLDNVHLGLDGEPEDGIEFQGWWEVEHHSVDQIL